MRALSLSQDEMIKHIPYVDVINSCEGIEATVKAVIACIDPQIRALEDQIVTPSLYVKHYS